MTPSTSASKVDRKKKVLLVAPLDLGISGNCTTTRRLAKLLDGFFDVTVHGVDDIHDTAKSHLPPTFEYDVVIGLHALRTAKWLLEKEGTFLTSALKNQLPPLPAGLRISQWQPPLPPPPRPPAATTDTNNKRDHQKKHHQHDDGVTAAISKEDIVLCNDDPYADKKQEGNEKSASQAPTPCRDSLENTPVLLDHQHDGALNNADTLRSSSVASSQQQHNIKKQQKEQEIPIPEVASLRQLNAPAPPSTSAEDQQHSAVRLKPFILIFGGTDINVNGKKPNDVAIMRVAVDRAVKIVCFSSAVVDTALAIWPHIASKLVIIPQTVDESIWKLCDKLLTRQHFQTVMGPVPRIENKARPSAMSFCAPPVSSSVVDDEDDQRRQQYQQQQQPQHSHHTDMDWIIWEAQDEMFRMQQRMQSQPTSRSQSSSATLFEKFRAAVKGGSASSTSITRSRSQQEQKPEKQHGERHDDSCYDQDDAQLDAWREAHERTGWEHDEWFTTSSARRWIVMPAGVRPVKNQVQVQQLVVELNKQSIKRELDEMELVEAYNRSVAAQEDSAAQEENKVTSFPPEGLDNDDKDDDDDADDDKSPAVGENICDGETNNDHDTLSTPEWGLLLLGVPIDEEYASLVQIATTWYTDRNRADAVILWHPKGVSPQQLTRLMFEKKNRVGLVINASLSEGQPQAIMEAMVVTAVQRQLEEQESMFAPPVEGGPRRNDGDDANENENENTSEDGAGFLCAVSDCPGNLAVADDSCGLVIKLDDPAAESAKKIAAAFAPSQRDAFQQKREEAARRARERMEPIQEQDSWVTMLREVTVDF